MWCGATTQHVFTCLLPRDFFKAARARGWARGDLLLVSFVVCYRPFVHTKRFKRGHGEGAPFGFGCDDCDGEGSSGGDDEDDEDDDDGDDDSDTL